MNIYLLNFFNIFFLYQPPYYVATKTASNLQVTRILWKFTKHFLIFLCVNLFSFLLQMYFLYLMKFQLFTTLPVCPFVLQTENVIWWDETLCGFVRHFGPTYLFHLQHRKWERFIPTTRLYLSTKLHRIT
jgi:hypothetical protein